MNKNVLLFSTGLDSFISNWILTRKGIDFERVYYNLKSVYSKSELEFLRMMYNPLYSKIENTIDISSIEKDDLYVPNSNLLLDTLAQGTHDADTVYLSGVKDDRVGDQTKKFYKKTSKVLTEITGKPVNVTSILFDKEKSEWCKYFAEKKEGRYWLLTHTYSCFSPKFLEHDMFVYEKDSVGGFRKTDKITIFGCMKCVACYRRLAALTSINIFVPFLNLKLVNEYTKKIDKNIYPNRYKTSIDYYNFINYWTELLSERDK